MSSNASPLTPGSNAGPAAGRPDTPATRRGRPPLGVRRIVAVALQIVDEVGVQAFTMRMLADALNSGTATLYRHFASKDEIMAHVLDLVLGEVDVDPAEVAGRSWQDAITITSDRFYEVLRCHPQVLPLLVSQFPVGPNGLANRERVLRLLLARGFAPELAARAFWAIGHYIVGFAIQQHSPAAAQRDTKQLHKLYRTLDAATFPATAATAPYLSGRSAEEEFHFGLTMLLTGIDDLHARATASEISPATPRTPRR